MSVRRTVEIDASSAKNLMQVKAMFFEAGINITDTTLLNMMLELGLQSFEKEQLTEDEWQKMRERVERK